MEPEVQGKNRNAKSRTRDQPWTLVVFGPVIAFLLIMCCSDSGEVENEGDEHFCIWRQQVLSRK